MAGMSISFGGSAPAPPAAPFQSGGTGGGGGQIGGALPFASMAGNATMPTDPNSLGSHYANAYRSALAMNTSNYNNILAGYQQTLAGQKSAQDAISGGYTNLYNNVLSGLQNQGQSQQEQINRNYASQLGQQSQQLIDRGLGNSTIQSAVARGTQLDRNLASNQLSEQLGRQYADYASNLGLAGLNYQNQANMQNTQLAQNQLGWMNSVNSPYPDAGMYSALAQQYGMAQQAAQDRANFNRYNPANAGRPAGGGTLSGTYGPHFSNDFTSPPSGSGVQLGGGGGGGTSYDPNLLASLGIRPGQNFSGGGSATPDYSAYGEAAAGAANDAYNSYGDLSAMYGVPGVGTELSAANDTYDPLY